MTAVIILDTHVLDRIARNLNANTEKVGLELAFKIVQEAIPLAPVDTGALRNSIYVSTKESNIPPSPIGGVDQVPLPTPTGKTIANVGPCVNYAVYQEFGTYKMAAHPFLIPAFERVLARANSATTWKELFE